MRTIHKKKRYSSLKDVSAHYRFISAGLFYYIMVQSYTARLHCKYQLWLQKSVTFFTWRIPTQEINIHYQYTLQVLCKSYFKSCVIAEQRGTPIHDAIIGWPFVAVKAVIFHLISEVIIIYLLFCIHKQYIQSSNRYCLDKTSMVFYPFAWKTIMKYQEVHVPNAKWIILMLSN